MATRSLIGVKVEDEVRYVYCHHDGYPTEKGVGGKLLRYWQTPESVKELLIGDKGDINSLGSDIESTKRFSPSRNLTDELSDYGTREWLKECYWDIEYVYLFDEKWFYKEANAIEWKELKELSHSLY